VTTINPSRRLRTLRKTLADMERGIRDDRKLMIRYPGNGELAARVDHRLEWWLKLHDMIVTEEMERRL
jgi:hypothetical protein